MIGKIEENVQHLMRCKPHLRHMTNVTVSVNHVYSLTLQNFIPHFDMLIIGDAVTFLGAFSDSAKYADKLGYVADADMPSYWSKIQWRCRISVLRTAQNTLCFIPHFDGDKLACAGSEKKPQPLRLLFSSITLFFEQRLEDGRLISYANASCNRQYSDEYVDCKHCLAINRNASSDYYLTLYAKLVVWF
jgi:hypothetical protein